MSLSCFEARTESIGIGLDFFGRAWGHNGYGQCNVPEGEGFVAIAGGERHSLALKADGSLKEWGRALLARAMRLEAAILSA